MKRKEIAKLLGISIFCITLGLSAPTVVKAQEQGAETVQVQEEQPQQEEKSAQAVQPVKEEKPVQEEKPAQAEQPEQEEKPAVQPEQEEQPVQEEKPAVQQEQEEQPVQEEKPAAQPEQKEQQEQEEQLEQEEIPAQDKQPVQAEQSVSENEESAPAKATDKDIADGKAANNGFANGETADKVSASSEATDKDIADGKAANKDINESAAKKNAAADSTSQVPAQNQPVQVPAGDSDASVSLRNSMLLTAKLSEVRRAPADQTGTVISVGSNQQYATLRAAVASLGSQTGNNVTIQITSDLEETNLIKIESGRTVTLIGNGTGTTLTLSGDGRFQVDGGSLILGGGDAASPKLTIKDSRTTGGYPAIQVTNGGSLTLNDGAEVNTNNAAGNGRAVSVGDSSSGGKISKYTGSGGSVTGGSLYLSNNSEASISGGTYVTSNSKSDGAVVVDGGHVTEISGGTFIGITVSNSGSLTGTFNGLLARESSSQIDKISGGTFIGSAAALSLNPGACVSEIAGGNFFGGSLAENKEPADIISESDITWSSGYAIFNAGTIEKITGGKFTGGTALQNYYQGHIGMIAGSEDNHLSFTGKNTTGSGIYLDGTSSIDSISYADIRSSGYYGINNNGKLGEISGSTITSDSYDGLVNSGTIDSITDRTQIISGRIGIWNKANSTVDKIESSVINAGSSYGIYNAGSVNRIGNSVITTKGDYGIYNGSVIKTIEDSIITTKGKYGIYNAGTIDSLSRVNAKAGTDGDFNYAGLFNSRNGRIDKVESSSFEAGIWGIVNNGTLGILKSTSAVANGNGAGQSYASSIYGLYNCKNTFGGKAVIQSIESSSFQGNTYGLYNYQRGAVIGTVNSSSFIGNTAGLVNYSPESTSSEYSLAVIYMIKNSIFEGGKYGAWNTGDARIEIIGENNVFYGKNESDSYGYLNSSANETAIEPDLTDSGKAIGTGRYRGAAAGIASADPQKGLSYPAAYGNHGSGAGEEGTDILYHLSLNSTDAEADEAILLADVTRYPDIKFRYLKLYHTLSYDKNASTATGTVSSQTETQDGEKLSIAQNTYARSGWQFTGWNTQADGKGKAYSPSDSVQLLDNQDMILYAQWTPYSLSYDKNSDAANGTMDAVVPDADESTVTVSGSRFTRSGWHFTGWNTQADGSGTSVDAETVLTLDKDTVLYAQWSPYEVSYDGNGSTGGTMDPSVSPEDGSAITVAKNSFTRDGYIFTGWNTSPDGSGTVVKPDATLSQPLESDVTLYAQWEKEETPQPEPDTPEKPETPEKPKESGTPESGSKSSRVKTTCTAVKAASLSVDRTVSSGSKTASSSPKTGDGGSLPWILSVLISTAGIFGIGKKKKK